MIERFTPGGRNHSDVMAAHGEGVPAYDCSLIEKHLGYGTRPASQLAAILTGGDQADSDVTSAGWALKSAIDDSPEHRTWGQPFE